MQNGRTSTLMSTYKPQLSIVVYKSDRDYYLESHDINEQGQVMGGKPLLQETIQEIVDVFFDEKKNTANIKGLIPENMLCFTLLPGGNYKMVWYRPAELRVMHFAPQLKITTGKTWVPAMIYVVIGRGLSVFASRANSRPIETTKIFRAPFHNVSEDGKVCLGNARVKKPKEKTYAALMKYWEDLFWLSEFSHFNGSDKPVKTDLDAVWKKLLNGKMKLKWSDINELMEYKNKTLKSLLQ